MALLNETMLDAFGFPHSPQLLRSFVAANLKLRGQVLQLFPPKTQADFLTDLPQRSYPTSYQISDWGPPSMLKAFNKSEGYRQE